MKNPHYFKCYNFSIKFNSVSSFKKYGIPALFVQLLIMNIIGYYNFPLRDVKNAQFSQMYVCSN